MSVCPGTKSRTGEVKHSYWGSQTPVLGRSNPRTGENADPRRGEALPVPSENEIRPVCGRRRFRRWPFSSSCQRSKPRRVWDISPEPKASPRSGCPSRGDWRGSVYFLPRRPTACPLNNRRQKAGGVREFRPPRAAERATSPNIHRRERSFSTFFRPVAEGALCKTHFAPRLAAQDGAVGDLEPHATVRGLALLALAGRERHCRLVDRNANRVEVASELRHPPRTEVRLRVADRGMCLARTRTRARARGLRDWYY